MTASLGARISDAPTLEPHRRDGNGALAGIAADLALKSDPTYGTADLLTVALSHGLDPRTLPKLRATAARRQVTTTQTYDPCSTARGRLSRTADQR
jgi:hypothetical protein